MIQFKSSKRIHSCSKGLKGLLFGLAFHLAGSLVPIHSQAYEVAFENDPSLPLVYINVALKTGSVTDPINKEGLTNFMGEMLLRGTQSQLKKDLDLALDQMGAKLEFETRSELLILRGAVRSAQLLPFLNLLKKIVTEPSFPEDEIRKLKSEITSGLQEELGHDGALASRRFSRFLFQDHPYGKSVLGKINDLSGFTRNDIQAHYSRIFRDEFLLVVGSGDANESIISMWSKELSRRLPNAPLTPLDQKILQKVSAPNQTTQIRLQIIDKPDRTQTQINVGQIGLRMTDKDFFPLYLGNYAFGGPSFSSVLMQEVRVKRGWSYGANSAFRFGLQPRSWYYHLFPASKDASAALALTLKLTEDLRKNGLSAETFEQAKQSLVNNSGFMYNTSRKRVENLLLEKTLDLPTGFIKSYGKALSKVTLSEVNAALNRFLQPNRLTISVLGTAGDIKEDLAKAAGVPIERVVVSPYTQEE